MIEPETDRTYAITYCVNFASAETKHLSWPILTKAFTKSKPYPTKEASVARAMIVGGPLVNEAKGRKDNITTRELITLDYDDFDGTFEDVEYGLAMNADFAFAAYSTFRSTLERPRFRVVIPASRPMDDAEHRAAVRDIADRLDLGPIDPCSLTINQGIFLPSHTDGVEPWSLAMGSTPYAVPRTGKVSVAEDAGEADDLMAAVVAQPLDIDDDTVATLLENYQAEGLDYDQWLRVGMAIAHQTTKSAEGFKQWVNWSAQSSKHDLRHMKIKWKSFGGSGAPVTMASVIHAAGGLSQGAEIKGGSEVAQSLEDQATSISTMTEYGTFKARVQAMNPLQMPPDIRSRLATIAHEVWAKGQGMGLRDVKSAFKHTPARRAEADVERAETPEWLQDWVFSEIDNAFVNTSVEGYEIKREAFRAKFDRLALALPYDIADSADYALNSVQIPTVMRGIYWPGFGRLFEHNGAQHFNTYHTSGAGSCEALDADGQGVVNLFLEHVRGTIQEEREQHLLIDFLAYVYRNPGKRVNWGMLLWGIEGNGKTYFFKLMQHLMGSNANAISTSVIERPFTDWAVGSRLIGIEEIRISGVNKWAILDRLKPMISDDVISVEPKGKKSYKAPNFSSYLMTTNHADAVPVSDNDRRFCAIFTRQHSKEDLFEQHGGEEAAKEYFKTLFRETERRPDAIGRFLEDWTYSDEFEPQGRAPKTAGIDEMKDANKSDDRIAVEQAIEDQACGVVSDVLIDVSYLAQQTDMSGEPMPQNRLLGNVLRDLGYVPIKNRRVKVGKNQHSVWFKPSPERDLDWAKKTVRDFHTAGDEFAEVPF